MLGWDVCGSLPVPSAWRRLVWAPQAWPLRLGACGARLGSPGPAPASRGLWRSSRLPGPGLCVSGPVALVSAPRARPLRPGSSVDWFWLPVPAPSVSGLVALASSHRLPSFSRSLCALLPAVLRGLCVLPRFVRLPCLCTPGLPSAQGLCGLLGFVCCASLSYLGPPSGLKGLCALVTFVPFRGILSIPEPTVWLGPQSVSC